MAQTPNEMHAIQPQQVIDRDEPRPMGRNGLEGDTDDELAGDMPMGASSHAECLPTIGQMFADLMCRTLRSLTLRSLTLESGDSIANDGGKCSKSTLRLRYSKTCPASFTTVESCLVFNFASPICIACATSQSRW